MILWRSPELRWCLQMRQNQINLKHKGSLSIHRNTCSRLHDLGAQVAASNRCPLHQLLPREGSRKKYFFCAPCTEIILAFLIELCGSIQRNFSNSRSPNRQKILQTDAATPKTKTVVAITLVVVYYDRTRSSAWAALNDRACPLGALPQIACPIWPLEYYALSLW